MSKWENVTMGLKYAHGKINHDSKDAEDYVIKEDEIALKHPDSEAIVRLTDDGFVDIFAGDALGIRIDPITNSVNLIGDNVNIVANQLNLKTKPYGFTWNGRAFDPTLYTEDKGIMTEMRKKARYSDGMIEMMKDFGLPVEKEDSNG